MMESVKRVEIKKGLMPERNDTFSESEMSDFLDSKGVIQFDETSQWSTDVSSRNTLDSQCPSKKALELSKIDPYYLHPPQKANPQTSSISQEGNGKGFSEGKSRKSIQELHCESLKDKKNKKDSCGHGNRIIKSTSPRRDSNSTSFTSGYNERFTLNGALKRLDQISEDIQYSKKKIYKDSRQINKTEFRSSEKSQKSDKNCSSREREVDTSRSSLIKDMGTQTLTKNAESMGEFCDKNNIGVMRNLDNLKSKLDVDSNQLNNHLKHALESFEQKDFEKLFKPEHFAAAKRNESCHKELKRSFFDLLEKLNLESLQESLANNSTVDENPVLQLERVKRKRCEQEIGSLQKQILDMKEQAAVFETSLKEKDIMLVQVAVAWSYLSNNVKEHKQKTEEIFQKLQEEHASLIEDSKLDNEKIKACEQKIADMSALQEKLKNEGHAYQQENAILKQKLSTSEFQLKSDVSSLDAQLALSQSEVSTLTKALEDANKTLEENKSVVQHLKSILNEMQSKEKVIEEKYLHICDENNMIKLKLKSLNEEKAQLESKLNDAEKKLFEHDRLKDEWEQQLTAAMNGQFEEKAQKLHVYYNEKMQEYLSESYEKAAETESTALKAMKTQEKEYNENIKVLKENHEKEMKNLKRTYQAQLTSLLEENEQKQQLIHKTAQQLQTGEMASLAFQKLHKATNSKLFQNGAVKACKNLNTSIPDGKTRVNDSARCREKNLKSKTTITTPRLPNEFDVEEGACGDSMKSPKTQDFSLLGSFLNASASNTSINPQIKVCLQSLIESYSQGLDDIKQSTSSFKETLTETNSAQKLGNCESAEAAHDISSESHDWGDKNECKQEKVSPDLQGSKSALPYKRSIQIPRTPVKSSNLPPWR